MSINFEKIKKVNPKVNNLIFGYFRRYHHNFFPTNNPYYSLQPLLVYTCITYYHIKHEWDKEKMNKDDIVNDDGVITKIHWPSSKLFLKDTISSGSDEYEFKIIEYDTTMLYRWRDIIIGPVLSSRCDDLKVYSCFNVGYSYCASFAELKSGLDDDAEVIKHQNIEIFNGCVIKLRIDLDKQELEYFVDDKSVGIIKGIRKETYVIAVYLLCTDTKIQLLH